MTINAPEEVNFSSDKPHPLTVNLDDVKAVELEVESAHREGRKPRFKDFPENAVKAAGYNAKGEREPLPEHLVSDTMQVPITQSGLSDVADAKFDAVKLGELAKAEIADLPAQNELDSKPEDQSVKANIQDATVHPQENPAPNPPTKPAASETNKPAVAKTEPSKPAKKAASPNSITRKPAPKPVAKKSTTKKAAKK